MVKNMKLRRESTYLVFEKEMELIYPLFAIVMHFQVKVVADYVL